LSGPRRRSAPSPSQNPMTDTPGAVPPTAGSLAGGSRWRRVPTHEPRRRNERGQP
jgi:hypothetical protein